MRRSCVSPSRVFLVTVLACIASGLWWALLFAPAAGAAPAAQYAKQGKRPPAKPAPVIAAAKQYAEAIASGDRGAYGRPDFDGPFALVSVAAATYEDGPPGTGPGNGQRTTARG